MTSTFMGPFSPSRTAPIVPFVLREAEASWRDVGERRRVVEPDTHVAAREVVAVAARERERQGDDVGGSVHSVRPSCIRIDSVMSVRTTPGAISKARSPRSCPAAWIAPPIRNRADLEAV